MSGSCRFALTSGRVAGRMAGMSFLNFLSGQTIDVIEWIDDSRDTLSMRYVEASNHEIKRGAQLTVRELQVAQFASEGEYGDTFGPGRHVLTTPNIPILTSLQSWKYGFESPFKADVYFVVMRLFTGNRWGTANPIMMRDADFRRGADAGVRDVRFSDHRAPVVPERRGRDRRGFPVGGVSGDHALADRERVFGRAGEREGAHPGRGDALRGTGRGAAAANQPASAEPIRAGDHGVHRGERVRAGGSRAGD